MAIAVRLRRRVVERAKNRCEYCGLSAAAQEAAFHVDHIVPVADSGATELDNLALACVLCSLRKGARHDAPDPHTGENAAIFHPRHDDWKLHFRWQGERIIGLTPTGRATVMALRMNRPLALAIRREEAFRERHPPN